MPARSVESTPAVPSPEQRRRVSGAGHGTGDAGPDRVLQEPPLRRPELRRPRAVVYWQQRAGNRAVSSALARPAAVQRETPAGSTSLADPQVELVRAQLAWLDGVIVGADDACVDAQLVSNLLRSPFQDRLRMLIDEVVDDRNWLDERRADLAASLADPDQSPAYSGELNTAGLMLRNRVHDLFQVSDAWRAVQASGIWELLASVGEAQLERARALRQELLDCHAELQRLNQIAEGLGMAKAFAKLGINLAITAISVAFPPAGLAAAIAYEAAKLGVDHLLGSGDGPSAPTLTASGVSVAGSALETFAGARQGLEVAGRRLGAAGTIAGHAIDALDTAEAIREYEQAVVNLADLGRRMERLSHELVRLEPLLRYPATARAIIGRLRGHAETLRAEGQVVLQETGQL